MVAATDSGQLPPKLPAGIARAKSPKSMGVRSGNWPTLRQAQAPLNAPDITTAQEARDSAIVAVLLGCALRRSEVAALADGRCSGDRRRLPAQLSASGPAGSPSGRRSRSRTRRTSRPPRACAPAPSSRRAARLRPAPFRTGGAQRWALFRSIHAGGDGRRAARECAGAVGSACDTIRMLATSATDHGRRAPERAAEPSRHIATIERACARRRRGCWFVIGACDDGARGASTISGETPFANNPESVYPVYPPY